MRYYYFISTFFSFLYFYAYAFKNNRSAYLYDLLYMLTNRVSSAFFFSLTRWYAAGSQFNYVKHWIDSLDKENFTYCYTIIEGDALMDTLESIYYEVKLVASPDGGSICKNISKYHTKGDIQITEDQIKAGKEKAMGMFKAIEAYLLANPDAY